MPIRRRSSKRSSSFMALTSWPSTQMLPRLGRSRPIVSFRMVLLPEPATPSSALVSPRSSEKEMPSRTGLPSKLMATSSNTMTGWGCPSVRQADDSAGRTGAGISLEQVEKQLRCEVVYRQDQDGCGHHGLGSGAPHPLGTAARGQAVVAAYSSHQEAEQQRLNEPNNDVAEFQALVGVAPVLVCVQVQPQLRNRETAGQPEEVADDGEEKQHDDGSHHARRDQLLGRIGAQGPHGVNLLGDFHRAQFAGHA